jgi:multiple sugar transport system substrate-binding protein
MSGIGVSLAVGQTRRRALQSALVGGGGLLAAACGVAGGQEGGGGRTQALMTLRFYYRIPSDIVKQSYDVALGEWKKLNPAITLETEAADSATFGPRLQAQLAAGTPPDVSPCDWNEFIDWAFEGTLLPIDDQMKAAKVSPDEWFPGPMDYGRLNGQYYGLPITGYTTVVYYNRNLFQQAGVPLPPTDGSWRWSDLESRAIRLTRREPDSPQTSQWGLMATATLPSALGSAIWQNGGQIADKREYPTKTLLDQPASIEAIQWLADLNVKHRVVPTPAETQALGKDPFVLGKVGMVWGPMSLFFNTMLPITDFTWDLVPGPRGPGGKQAAVTQTNVFGMFKGTKQPEAAFKLIYFFTAGPGVRVRAEIQQVAVAHKRALQDVWMKAKPAVNRQAVVDSHPYTQDLFKARLISKWTSATQPPLNRAVMGQMPVSAAVEEAVRQGNVVFDEANARK